ncbi:MAG TPA: DUF2079 domain-containing protein [Actinoplanes sp.]
MSVVVAPPAEPADPADPADAATETVARPAVRHRWRWHVTVAVLALALGAWVTNGLWRDPYSHGLYVNVSDQAFFEWLLGYGVYTLQHGADPFFTGLMNVPDGVNLAVNTSITVYTVLFSPLTMLAGPQMSFVVILTLNLACGAFAWYLFLLRFVVRHPAAAAVAGFFCGFAPGLVSHANGHLNWSAGWVAPVVVWRVLKLREPGHWLRNGVLLGLMLAVGFSIAAEALFFTALACFVFLLTWSLSRSTWREARAALPRVTASLTVAAAVAGTILAYPLYMHFAGPQSFGGTGFNQRRYSEDLGAYLSYAHQSLAGWAGFAGPLAPNLTEETSFFGPPLVLLVVVALVLLRRGADRAHRAVLRALSITGVVFLVLSLGPRLHFYHDETDIPLPYAVLGRLPLFNSALPARYSLVVAGVVGIVLALAADRALRTSSRPWRAVGGAGLAVALVPLFPVALPWQERFQEPAFIANGTWQRYVPADGVLLTLPVASNVVADGQRWQAYTMARGGRQFRIPGGYFLGPGGEDDTGRIGAIPRRTAWLMERAARYGEVRTIKRYDRDKAREDFAYWGVDAVFVPDYVSGARGALHRDAVLKTTIALLGPPQRVDDVLLWDIRPGIDPVEPQRSGLRADPTPR